jgi:hypothetical protein
MGALLTIASQVTCPHQGKVSVAGDSTLTINQQAVVPQAQVASAAVSGCLTQNSNSTKQCLKVVPPVSGASLALTVNGQPIMTDSLSSATDGVPAATISAPAGQSVFTAG